MGTFISYALPGIPTGCEYALMAVGLVITFRATGVFNIAFGAQAFVSAFAFDLLNQYGPHWNQWICFLVAVLIVAPLMGLALDRFLFRHIPTASTTVKLVSSLGLLVAIPQTIPIIFGASPRYNIGFLWLNPQTVYFHAAGIPINGWQITNTVLTVVIVFALMAVFKWTSVGLKMRAVVESRRLSQLEGVNASGVAAGAWALSSVLAGLSGVLLLPHPEPSGPDEHPQLHDPARGGHHSGRHRQPEKHPGRVRRRRRDRDRPAGPHARAAELEQPCSQLPAAGAALHTSRRSSALQQEPQAHRAELRSPLRGRSAASTSGFADS